jgi:hypothetical protein
MQVIPVEKFPRILTGYRRFQTVQVLWEKQPERRAELARGLRRMCQSINRLVTAGRPV